MPRLPRILADLGEKGFGQPCSVRETTYIDKALKKVRFEADLQKAAFMPGQVTEFRVGPNDFRHYTFAHFDPRLGIYDIFFYLHDEGPGSKWASALEAGQTVKMLGVGGKMKLASDSRRHFFFGDETALGLFHCLKNAIETNGQEYLGILELDEDSKRWPEMIGLSVDTVSKATHPDKPADEAVSYLNDLNGTLWKTWVNASFYLAGRAASIQAFRKALLARGVRSANISTYPYWSEGKIGL